MQVASTCMISCFPHLPEHPSSHTLRLLQRVVFPSHGLHFLPQVTGGFLLRDLAEAFDTVPRMIFPWELQASTFSAGL